MGRERYVAFGTFLTYQTVHRIEDDHLVQISSFYPAFTKSSQTGIDVTDEGEATAAELGARYGRVSRLPDERLEQFRGRLAIYRRSAEANAERVAEERRVNVKADPVLRIEILDRFASAWEHGQVAPDELIAQQTLEVADRVSRLSEEEMANYENWRRQLTSPLGLGGRPRPTEVEPDALVWLAAARAALEFAHRQP